MTLKRKRSRRRRDGAGRVWRQARSRERVKLGVLNAQRACRRTGGRARCSPRGWRSRTSRRRRRGSPSSVSRSPEQGRRRLADATSGSPRRRRVIARAQFGVALAINQLVTTRTSVHHPARPRPSHGPRGSPNTVMTYTVDAANGRQQPCEARRHKVVLHQGRDAFGHALERDTEPSGRRPAERSSAGARPSHADFLFLLQAQSSKAKITGLANAGGDTIKSISGSSSAS